ncbi:MAG: hypothetical protein U0S49_15685 [Rhodospirillales bacterium]|nr:hypothetical protein [Rhodospirillales bacterium]
MNAARPVHRWASKNAARVWYGSGSFVPVIESEAGEHYPFRCKSDGSLEINFQYLMSKPPFAEEAKRLDMLARLNAIPGVSIAPDRADKRPSIPVGVLTDPAALRHFLSVLDWAVAEIRRFTNPAGGR